VEPGAEADLRIKKPHRDRSRSRPAARTYLLLALAWLLLAASGAAGTIVYAERMRERTANEVTARTQAQIDELKARYDAQISELRDSVNRDIDELKAKVESLNQLLTFVKDNANTRADNSNQLYNQMEEVRKQLEELRKNLEVLK